MLDINNIKIAVIGLGYVGLPLAVEFGKHLPVVGFDINASRDFNFIENAVQANILAATATEEAKNQVYNVAVGGRTTLNTLFSALKEHLSANGVSYTQEPVYRDFREGDVRHSQADISKIQNALGYAPQFDIIQGIEKAMPWYKSFLI
jgi:UDP-N-acetylglucosamine 4-epimerase